MRVRDKLLLAGMALVGILVVGTIGYHLIEDVGFADAAYMTIITVSTVGLQEVWDLSPAGRLWTSVLILVGILIVTLVFALLQAMIVSGEMRTLLGRRRLEDSIAKLSGHFIVCGYGRMGRLICAGLRERGKEVIVVDVSSDRTALAGEAGMNYVLGDAADEETLKAAGLERAAGVVSVLPSDAQNVYVALTASGVTTDVPVTARAEDPGSEKKLLRAGVRHVISPQAIGATRIVNLLIRPTVARIVDVVAGGGEWEVEEFPLRPASKLVGRTLQELNLRQTCDALVFAISRADGALDFNPNPVTKLQAEDVLIIVGPAGIAESLAALDA